MRKLLILFNCLFIALASMAQKGSGFEKLFNGKNLSGWEQKGNGANFSAKNNELVATTDGNTGRAWLVSNKLYGDFVLEFELMAGKATSATVLFRSNMEPDGAQGYQCVINPTSPIWNNAIYCGAGRGYIYTAELSPSGTSAFKPNAWNHYRIECVGNQIRTWVNNAPVAYIVDNKILSGSIALQIEGADVAGQQVRWKNINIKTSGLKPTETADTYIVNLIPNTLTKAEKEQGWNLLFDGETNRGWVNVNNKTNFPEEGWIIQNGMIEAIPNRPGARVRGVDIVSTEKFKAFDLQFEFSYAEGANSGIKYGLGNGGPTIGLEYQILDDKKHPDANGGKLGNRRLSSLYDLIPADRLGELTNGPGNWNYGRVVLYPDNRVEHWLNGVKVLEYVRGSSIYNVLVAHSKYAGFEGFGMVEESPILLQYHQDEVKFRSLKIRNL